MAPVPCHQMGETSSSKSRWRNVIFSVSLLPSSLDYLSVESGTSRVTEDRSRWKGWEHDSPSLHQPTGPPHQKPEVAQIKHSHGCKPNQSKANHPLWQVVKMKELQPRQQRLSPHIPKFHHAKKKRVKSRLPLGTFNQVKTKFSKVRVTSQCAFAPAIYTNVSISSLREVSYWCTWTSTQQSPHFWVL